MKNENTVMNLYLNNSNYLATVAKALSLPIRLEILQLIQHKPGLIIKEIAEELNIPASTAAVHVNLLEDADMIIVEEMPGVRGSVKRCHIRTHTVHLYLNQGMTEHGVQNVSEEMLVGCFSSCEIREGGTCGLSSADGMIGTDDDERWFYSPQKYKAGIVWLSAGYLEYKIPNSVPKGSTPLSVTFSMELCSEACVYDETWKSDISFWINEIECGTWRSPGDMGKRRGLITPDYSKWPLGVTQYGFLVQLEVKDDGCYINNSKVSSVSIRDLDLMKKAYVKLRIGNKKDAKYVGGINIFGKEFGDYKQDIIMNITY